MSEREHHEHERDEQVSAHLDGEATPDEAAAIAAQPELVARADTLAAASAVLREEAVPRVPDHARDAAIRNALDAYDDSRNAPNADRDELARARDRRTSRRLRVVGIAAAVLLAVLAVPVLTRDTGDDASDVATEAGQSAAEEDASTGGDALAADSPEASAAAEDRSPTLYEGPSDIGVVASTDELEQRVRALLGAEPTPSEFDGSAVDVRCSANALELIARGEIVFHGVAQIDSRRVTVLVVADENDRHMVVFDDVTCSTVVNQPLE
jgi:hypothetical protein